MLNRMVYRANQFFRALWCRVRTDEYTIIETHLSPAQQTLFYRMHRIDQRHSLDVFHTLYAAGHRDPALLQAALLHDIGKAAGGITIFHRVAVVLMSKYVPGILDRWTRDGKGWKTPLAVHLLHAQISAEWAAASSSSDVVALITDHHCSTAKDERSAALRWADGQN